MKAVKEINIYLLRKRNAQNIDVVQYDTGIQLVFNVLDFEIPAGTTATLYVQKPSGKFVYQQQNISVVDNIIVIALENQAITEHGRTPYQITLTNGNDEISTFSGVLCVEKSLKNAGAVESKTVIKAFDEVIADKVAEFQNRAETAANAVIATIPDDYSELSAKVGEMANGIKGHLSGAVVSADDVSPIEHCPLVKVICPEGVDLSTVTIRRSGKNILSLPYADGTSRTHNGITFTVNNDGSVRAVGTATATAYFNVALWDFNSNLNDIAFNDCAFNPQNFKTAICVNAGETVDKVFYPQVEFEKVSAFEKPCSATMHTPNADGTVYGITSLSPNMTLLTDTDGVTIECEYIKDTNKVIAKIADALNITI